MDYSSIPSKPWIPLASSQHRLKLRQKSLFEPRSVCSTRTIRASAKSIEGKEKISYFQNSFLVNNEKHYRPCGKTILLDANHPILNDTLPLPNPSFAFHQFEKNVDHRNDSKFKIGTQVNKRFLSSKMLFNSCCCDCDCISCVSKKCRSQYYHIPKDHFSCNMVDISSMNFFGIQYSTFSSSYSEYGSTLDIDSSSKSGSDDEINTNTKKQLHPKDIIIESGTIVSTLSNHKSERLFRDNICSKSSCSCRLRQCHHLEELKYLYAGDNNFSSLSQFSGLFSNLQELYLPGNQIYSLLQHDVPKQEKTLIISFPNLKVLDLSHNYLLGGKWNEKNKKITSSGFTKSFFDLMKEFSKLQVPNLEELNLSFNYCHSVDKSDNNYRSVNKVGKYQPPQDPACLSIYFLALKTVHLEGNNISDSDHIFEFLSHCCPSLKHINLMHNCLSFIPSVCVKDETSFSSLQKLNLGWNHISSEESLFGLVLLVNLERLILSGNPILHHNGMWRNDKGKPCSRRNSYGVDRILKLSRELREGTGDIPFSIVTETPHTDYNEGKSINRLISMSNGDSSKQIRKILFKLPEEKNKTHKIYKKENKRESIRNSEEICNNKNLSPRIVWEVMATRKSLTTKFATHSHGHEVKFPAKNETSNMKQNLKSFASKKSITTSTSVKASLRNLRRLTNLSERTNLADRDRRSSIIMPTASYTARVCK